MRSTLAAMALAAGLIGFGPLANAAPVPAGSALAGAAPVEQVQMSRMERRMVRRHMVRREMRREMRRDMRHRAMRRAIRRGY